MFQVLDAVQPKQTFGQKLSQGIGRGLEEGSRIAENYALKEMGIDVSGISDPNVRQQIIADQLAFGRKKKQAEASQKVSYADQLNGKRPENQPNRREQRELEREEETPYQRENLPDVYGKNLKTSKRSNEKPSINQANLSPQPQTKGKTFPLLNPDEIEQKGERIAMDRSEQGIPTSKDEGIQIALHQENEKVTHNQAVENDRRSREEHQYKMGQIAEKKIRNVLPDANDEVTALFKSKGEKAAEEHNSIAKLELQMSKEAKKFKNDLFNLEKSFPPPRLFSDIKGGFFGNNRKAEEAQADIRNKIKPFLELGLYDTVRHSLSNVGYAPEEREALITDLSENTTKNLSQIPKFEKNIENRRTNHAMFGQGQGIGRDIVEKEFDPETIEKIDNSIKDIFQSDPNTNLLLLRKAYEDKNVDWRTFKNAMNKMVLNGEIVLNEDQENQFNSYIDEPPLGPLDKLLNKIKLLGR